MKYHSTHYNYRRLHWKNGSGASSCTGAIFVFLMEGREREREREIERERERVCITRRNETEGRR